MPLNVTLPTLHQSRYVERYGSKLLLKPSNPYIGRDIYPAVSVCTAIVCFP
jgi:hypothetical protein